MIEIGIFAAKSLIIVLAFVVIVIVIVIAAAQNSHKNEIEINGLINLAKQGLVDIAVVGNEVLLRKELSEQELINYIKRVNYFFTTSSSSNYS